MTRGRDRFRAAVVALALPTLAALPWTDARAQDRSLEYAVKAAFLYKFFAFVDWPAGSLGPPGQPVNLCVVGDDPFGGALDRAGAGRSFDSRPIHVRRYRTASSGMECHVLYTRGSSAQSAAEVARVMADAPVLTVTDSDNPDEMAGILQFALENGRVRFRVDLRAASDSGLTLSSKLLAIALAVRR